MVGVRVGDYQFFQAGSALSHSRYFKQPGRYHVCVEAYR